MGLQLYGQPVQTLTEVVENLMIAQGNVKRNHYIAYMNHARWVYKQLLWKTLFSYTTKIVDVVDNKIVLPDNIIRLVSITVMDECHNMQPIVFNPNMFTMQVSCPTNTCSCKNCNGEDSLCAVIDQIQFRTEDVVINDVTYQRKIWNRVDGQGNLQEVIETPTWDAASGEGGVVYITQYVTKCALETFDNNCIKPTEKNRELIKFHCGCFLSLCNITCGGISFWNKPRLDLPAFGRGYGFYKYDEEQLNLLHLRHVKATKLIVTYQAGTEETHGEVLVPEFAVEAMMSGIVYRQKRYSEVASRLEKEGARKDFKREELELNKFLNPVNMSDFLNLQTEIPLW